MKIAIIGGGASGLVSAIVNKRKNNEVILIEKNDICGKKILKTGNGRCNYFNEEFTINHYRSDDIDILKKIITEENKEKILKFFDSIGVVPKIKNGCYYPFSNKAETILNSLLIEVNKLNINIICNANVLDINYNNKYLIKLENKEIIADKVVIATGSIASTKEKTNFGYEILKKFNHKIIKPLPALVQLVGNETYFKKWAGIRSYVNLSILESNKIIGTSKGEIMLTNYGVSGICVFDLSGRIKRGLNSNKEELLIDFLPCIDNFIEYIEKKDKQLKNRNIFELLEGTLNHKLIEILLEKSKIKKDSKLKEIDKKLLEKTFKKFKLSIIDTKSYLEAQVCSGGIPLSEININTMESLKQKGLYILGELLDVDGDCGGYNLGFAWLSAILMGEDND